MNSGVYVFPFCFSESLLGTLDVTTDVLNKLKAGFTQVTFYTHSSSERMFQLVTSSFLIYKIWRLIFVWNICKMETGIKSHKSYFCKRNKAWFCVYFQCVFVLWWEKAAADPQKSYILA